LIHDARARAREDLGGIKSFIDTFMDRVMLDISTANASADFPQLSLIYAFFFFFPLYLPYLLRVHSFLKCCAFRELFINPFAYDYFEMRLLTLRDVLKAFSDSKVIKT